MIIFKKSNNENLLNSKEISFIPKFKIDSISLYGENNKIFLVIRTVSDKLFSIELEQESIKEKLKESTLDNVLNELKLALIMYFEGSLDAVWNYLDLTDDKVIKLVSIEQDDFVNF